MNGTKPQRSHAQTQVDVVDGREIVSRVVNGIDVIAFFPATSRIRWWITPPIGAGGRWSLGHNLDLDPAEIDRLTALAAQMRAEGNSTGDLMVA